MISLKRTSKISRFRYCKHNKEPRPKFKPGDTAGEFNILEYLGYSTIRPDMLKVLKLAHHWYKVRCSCGVIEIHSQQQLIDTRRLRICKHCQSQLRTHNEN